MRIWDLHCHLPSNHMPAGTFTEQLERMLEIAGRVGIEKLGLFLPTGQPDGPYSDREILSGLTKHEGRVFGFVWCDLFKVQESIDKLKRWVGDGPMVGLKLGGYSGICNKPEYDPVFRQAIELKAVIYQHTWIKLGGDPPYPGGGNLPRESTPAHLVEVAARYPDYPMICGHTGGDWELGIRAVRASGNLSVGIGGGYPNQRNGRDGRSGARRRAGDLRQRRHGTQLCFAVGQSPRRSNLREAKIAHLQREFLPPSAPHSEGQRHQARMICDMGRKPQPSRTKEQTR